MTDQLSKHDHVLLSLTMNLQTMAMVQLGKVASPHTGELERDLEGARGTIDILDMLKVKCRHDTPEGIVKLLDQAVMDLQMNFLEEQKRDADGASTKQPTAETDAEDGDQADEDAAT